MRAHPHLFEISAWPWLERLSRREGRQVMLDTVPASEWDVLQKRGFDCVFLMGVWRRSEIGRSIALGVPDLRREYENVLPGWSDDDVPGSPYCVRDYVPDDRMGGWRGLDAARGELNRRGISLFVDFVPNHTAFDHPWVSAHPDWYVTGTPEQLNATPHEYRVIDGRAIACGRDPFFAPWTDVAQLNYFNREAREALIGTLRTIAAHADGVRCDMAMLVLNDIFDRTWRRVLRHTYPHLDEEFWTVATSAVPGLTFLAEVYWDLEWTLQQQGFHFTYDKRLLDRLHHDSVHALRDHLRADPSYANRLARFIENHDEPRSAATLGHRLVPGAVLMSTLPGMRFFFDGQFDGAQIRPPVQLGRWPEEWRDDRIRDLYERILRTTDHDVFHDGEWSLLESTSAGDDTFQQLIAYRWTLESTTALIVVNLSDAMAQAHLPHAVATDRTEIRFDDQLTDASYRWNREDLADRGLYVRLEPGASHLFLIETA
jgi:glycosidase